MSLFFVAFILIYGCMHVYAFIKARAAFPFGSLSGVFIALFMAAMVFVPMIIRTSEKQGFETMARMLSYTGYLWMGVLLLFCSVSAVMDIYRLVMYCSGLISQRDLSSLMPSPVYSFLLPFVVSISLAVYGYFEAGNIRTEKIVIKTPKISGETGRLTIVQLSDVHLGLIIREERLRRILAEVKKAGPDILVSTGDLVDGQINGLKGLSEMFREINPKYGKFAVTGNHEFYAGIDQAIEFTRDCGFTLLRGEYSDGPVNIAGVDDSTANTFGVSRGLPEEKLLSGISGGKFTILLKHKPFVKSGSTGLFDLQLSGHTHKGQIFPFSFLTKMHYPVDAGYAELEKHSRLYVNRGTGTWGPPIRFLSPPEVTVIELVHE